MQTEAEKRKGADQEVDALLKALSVAALFFKEIPEGYSDSVVYVAVTIIIISIASKGFFVVLNFLVTLFLGWLAFISGDDKLIGFAVLYLVMTMILLFELDVTSYLLNYALGGLWWAGQVLIHTMDLHFSYSPGPFTYLFFVVSIIMFMRCLGLGIKIKLMEYIDNHSKKHD